MAAAKMSLDDRYEAHCKEFNDYLLTSMKETSPLHSSIRAAYEKANSALMTPQGVSTSCEGAKKCWPFFDEFRQEIKATEEKALQYLPSEFGDMPAAWKTIDNDNRIEIWNMFQDMLQLLDGIHAIIPFAAYPRKKKPLIPTSFNKLDSTESTLERAFGLGNDAPPVAAPVAAAAAAPPAVPTNAAAAPTPIAVAAPTAAAAAPTKVESKDGKDSKNEEPVILNGKTKTRMAGLLGSLSALAGMDNKSNPMQAQIDATLSKLNRSDNKEDMTFTSADNQTLASVVQGVIDQTLPLTDETDPMLNDPNMDPKVREELRGRMELENQQLKRELQQKIATVGDPDAYPKEMMEEGERRVKARAAAREAAKKTKSDSEFSLCGHFNKNLFLLLEQLVQKRGALKSPSGKLFFPELVAFKEEMLTALQLDLATDEFIKPFGHWITLHLAKTNSLEGCTELLKEAKEPFLVSLKAKFLIQTLARHEWDEIMGKDETKRVLQFSKVYISLHKEGMGDFMEWINEVLKDCGMSTTKPTKINSRLLRRVLIERMHPAEIKRFEHLFANTGKEPSEAMLDLMERLVSMMQSNKSSNVSQTDVISAMAQPTAAAAGPAGAAANRYADYDD